MSTIKSSAENLTLNADGANNDIKFQSNGSEVAAIDQAGNLTVSGTVDGVDIQTLNTTAGAALPKAGGTMTGALTVNAAAVFNETSADVDFRVESNGNANALYVDGGNDNVGIGAVPSSALALTVKPASVNPSLTVQNTASGSRLAGSVWMAAQDRSSEGTQGSFAVLLHATSSNNSEIRIDLTTDSFRGGVVGTFWVTFGLGGANTMGAGWLSITKGADDVFAIFWDQQISQGGSPAITLTTTTASTTVLDAHLRIENTTHTYATYCVTKLSGGGGNGGDTPLFALHAL